MKKSVGTQASQLDQKDKEVSRKKEAAQGKKIRMLKHSVAVAMTRPKGLTLATSDGGMVLIGGRDRWFAHVSDGRGGRQLTYIDERKIVQRTSQAFLEEMVCKAFKHQMTKFDNYFYSFSDSDVSSTARLAKQNLECIENEDVWPIGTKDFDGYAYKKLDFDIIDEDRETPHFDQLLKYCSTNKNALIQWIGSLLDYNSDRSQYVYLYGKGANGKSRLNNWLDWVMGSAKVNAYEIPQGDSKRFFTSQTFGKRVLCFTDVNDYKMVRAPILKMLTGDDCIPFEEKGQPTFVGRSFVKVIFASNREADISGQESDLRRIIVVNFDQVPIDERMSAHEMDEGLRKETQAFLSKCVRAYKALGTMGPLPTERRVAEELAERNEGGWYDIADEFVVFDEAMFMHTSELHWLCEEAKLSHGAKKEFIRWMGDRFGVKPGVYRYKGDCERQWRGLAGVALKPGSKGRVEKCPRAMSWFCKDLKKESDEFKDQWLARLKKLGFVKGNGKIIEVDF